MKISKSKDSSFPKLNLLTAVKHKIKFQQKICKEPDCNTLDQMEKFKFSKVSERVILGKNSKNRAFLSFHLQKQFKKVSYIKENPPCSNQHETMVEKVCFHHQNYPYFYKDFNSGGISYEWKKICDKNNDRNTGYDVLAKKRNILGVNSSYENPNFNEDTISKDMIDGWLKSYYYPFTYKQKKFQLFVENQRKFDGWTKEKGKEEKLDKNVDSLVTDYSQNPCVIERFKKGGIGFYAKLLDFLDHE